MSVHDKPQSSIHTYCLKKYVVMLKVFVIYYYIVLNVNVLVGSTGIGKSTI